MSADELVERRRWSLRGGGGAGWRGAGSRVARGGRSSARRPLGQARVALVEGEGQLLGVAAARPKGSGSAGSDAGRRATSGEGRFRGRPVRRNLRRVRPLLKDREDACAPRTL